MSKGKKVYSTGIDIGSTTIKVALYDETLLVYPAYRRHHARAIAALMAILEDIREKFGDVELETAFTGSAGMGVAEKVGFPFVQEIVVSAYYLKESLPELRTFIEMGGEDAKVVFFDEQFRPQIRMNGSCAGGTGAFIEQMAALLDVSLQDFDKLAGKSASVYPIASRCGVFAKTDIQSLLSNHVAREDIAASVFHAVVLQVISTLLRGSEVKKKVLFAGGPLTFLPQLRNEFTRVLRLDPGRDVIFHPHSELIAASGAALCSGNLHRRINVKGLLNLLTKRNLPSEISESVPSVLFDSISERNEWEIRHGNSTLPRLDITNLENEDCFLGVDSGSTTTKMVLIDEYKRIILKYYASNDGDSIAAVKKGMEKFRETCLREGKGPRIARTAVTGYGEDLIRAAFGIDDGVVETMAHYRAAKSFDSRVSFILDIGGQDMKAIYIKDDLIADVQINEACSSGCGSFLQNFASSLGYDVADFAEMACGETRPFDLGTRCTVFMNSRVKQALREGATVADISAGLAYAVVKNSLTKVLRLKDPASLGKHVVVQGGTFRNPAVLRAFELILGQEVIRPDLSEMMGAYGAALTALNNYKLKEGIVSTFRGINGVYEEVLVDRKSLSCGGCENNCPVVKLTFTNGRNYVSGNRCERYFTNLGKTDVPGENLITRKLRLLFDRPMEGADPPLFTFGIPRVLNMYENFPFWSAFLVACGFKVVLSAQSGSGLFEKGVGTVMSDNVCFPGKLAHGHIVDLLHKKVDRIFYPTVVYEDEEFPLALNSYNCPIVTGYPDVIKSAIDPEGMQGIPMDSPVISFRDTTLLIKQLYAFFKRFGIKRNTVRSAVREALSAQREYKKSLRELTADIMRKAEADDRLIMVVAGRPYHADPLINQGIPEILSALGVDVVTEDGLPLSGERYLKDSRILTQWSFTNRIIAAADYVAASKLSGMVQLTSFGCGLDAVVSDEARAILTSAGRVYSIIKMDEMVNPGAVRIRLRALVEAIRDRSKKTPQPGGKVTRQEYISRASQGERTIIAPWFSSHYSPFMPGIFEDFGYKLELLPPPERSSVEIGLKYVHNDMCYPAVIIIGDVIKAMQSGEYNSRYTAVLFAQTFGQCRASNYVPLMSKALGEAGFGEVPVVSIAAGDSGLDFALETDRKEFERRMALGMIFSDVLAGMVLATAPREIQRGRAEKIRNAAMVEILPLLKKGDFKPLLSLLREAVGAFNKIQVADVSPPPVGLVGEIFVKYNNFSNMNMVEWLQGQGMEVVMPSLTNFFMQRFVNEEFDQCSYLKRSLKDRTLSKLLDAYVHYYLRQIDGVMRDFRYYRKTYDVHRLSQAASRATSLANQSGEGWLLTAEMINMALNGVEDVICLQPFGCLANHITGKGVEKRLKSLYPRLNLLFLDMDAGVSEINILNRLHFMLASVKKEKRDVNGLYASRYEQPSNQRH